MNTVELLQQGLPLADFGDSLPGILALFIPIVALMIPIVKLMVSHQQRMTEMMQQQQRALAEIEARRLQAPASTPDVNSQYEIAMLRDRLADMEKRLASAESSTSPVQQTTL